MKCPDCGHEFTPHGAHYESHTGPTYHSPLKSLEGERFCLCGRCAHMMEIKDGEIVPVDKERLRRDDELPYKTDAYGRPTTAFGRACMARQMMRKHLSLTLFD